MDDVDDIEGFGDLKAKDKVGTVVVTRRRNTKRAYQVLVKKFIEKGIKIPKDDSEEEESVEEEKPKKGKKRKRTTTKTSKKSTK